MEDEIRKLVRAYLDSDSVKIKHSNVWFEDMVDCVQKTKSKFPAQHIPIIYKNKTIQLLKKAISCTRSKLRNIGDIEDIVHEVYSGCDEDGSITGIRRTSMAEIFKPGKHPKEEEGWIIQWTMYAIGDYFKKKGIDTNEIIDPYTGEIEKVPVYATFEQLDYRIQTDEDYEVEDSKRINVIEIDSISREIQVKKTLEIHNESTVYFLDRMYWLTKPEQYNVRKTVDGEPIYDYGERARMEQIIRIDKEKNAAKLDAPDLYLKRHRVIKNASDIYYYMELCIELLKNSKEKFEKEIKQGYFEKSKKRTIPMLSAVAVDKEGILIGSCYKGEIESKTTRGERRTFQKHCEYSLFEEVITSAKDKERLKGGTLFVTLEPCNKRDPFSSAHGEKIPKIPCAVRCLEAGISKIYIGMFDTNKDIKYQGYNILKTGEYTFELENGCLDEKQIPLEDYFKKKKYKLLSDEKDKRVYKIHEGLGDNVLFFDDDLREEICELNATFLRFYDKDGIFV